MNNQSRLAVAVCSGALLFTGAAQAASITIDDFDTGPGEVTSATPGPTNFIAPGAIGGSRTLEILGYPTNSDPIPAGITLRVAVPPGQEGHSQNAFAPGGRSRTTWDANGGGLLSLDLTDGGTEDAFLLDIVSIDQGQLDITLNVTSNSHGTASLTSSSLSVGVLKIDYSTFAGFSTDIFENVDSIDMVIEAGQATDVTIDSIVTTGTPVPVPAAAWMGMTLLGGMGVVRKVRS